VKVVDCSVGKVSIILLALPTRLDGNC